MWGPTVLKPQVWIDVRHAVALQDADVDVRAEAPGSVAAKSQSKQSVETMRETCMQIYSHIPSLSLADLPVVSGGYKETSRSNKGVEDDMILTHEALQGSHLADFLRRICVVFVHVAARIKNQVIGNNTSRPPPCRCPRLPDCTLKRQARSRETWAPERGEQAAGIATKMGGLWTCGKFGGRRISSGEPSTASCGSIAAAQQRVKASSRLVPPMAV